MKRSVRSNSFYWCVVAGLLGATSVAWAQLGEVEFRQALRDLGTDLRLMCVAAHPDDEDGATLAYYRKKYGVTTIAVIATRGEGGQNEIGPELYNELGVIRTREMMAASQITGAQLRFLNLPEFGFSKSAEETFQIWGHDETVKRLVRVIREERPDVIITNHDTSTGHGHHQAIGRALLEAFDLAANKEAFPEQLAEEIPTWRPSRMFVRCENETPDAVTIDISELDELEGRTYAEIAAAALQEHKSQGMTAFIERYLTGRPKHHYRLVKEAGRLDSEGSILGRDEFFRGIPDAVSHELRTLALSHPDRATVKATLAAYEKSAEWPKGPHPWGLWEWRRIHRALALAGEIRLQARIDDAELTPGQMATVTAELTDFGEPDVEAAELWCEPTSWFSTAKLESRKEGGHVIRPFTIQIPATESPTAPLAEHLFDPHFLEPQVRVVASLTVAGAPIDIVAPLRVEVVPSISVVFSSQRYLINLQRERKTVLDLIVTNNTPEAKDGEVFMISDRLGLERNLIPVSFSTGGEERVLSVEADAPPDSGSSEYSVTAEVKGGVSKSSAKLSAAEIKVPEDVYVGVVQSYDDTFVQTLETLGVPHKSLRIEDFTPERLDKFATIIVDIRAYLVRPDLAANQKTFLEYVRRGGNLVVMYQKTFDWKPEYAPYPLHISNNRVTREDAPITVLTPSHPLFTTPNAIAQTDWDGWIQERGLYFADTWDPHFTPLIACSDPGEDSPPGSCLIAQYGDGHYMYVALALYRQLRELHPGALKFFANLLAL